MTNLPVAAPVTALASSPRRFRWTAGLIAGIILFSAVVLVAIITPFTLTGAANDLTNNPNLDPSGVHLLGTDSFGRDLLARSLVAARLTLIMTLAATAISVIAGVLIGTGIWLAPRRIREAGLRILEVAVSYPGLLVALVISAILGAGVMAVIIAIGISNIAPFARLTANLASAVSRKEYVSTARLLGVPGYRIVTRHLLPNMAEPLLILIASSFAVGLMEIAGLSFVGLGVQAPDYDFGKLLSDSLPAIYSRPIEAVGPALMIVITSLGMMLIGDGLAAAADPRGGRRALTRKARSEIPASLEESSDNLVAVENLTVTTAAGSELVHGISFTIRRGEILGVVGESGSGKSLTAMALARLLPEGLGAAAVELRVGSMNMLARVPQRTLATEVALVYQDPGSTFNPALRMGSQLTEVLRTHKKMPAGAASEAMVDALTAVHLTDPALRMKQHPHELSGGMQQRSMIAAAMATEPELIIADEPTTALDVTVQAGILRQFRRLNRQRNMSMLFISHDLGVVEALCDRILVMKEGRIVETLTAAQLAAGDVSHPYTQKLLDATPTVDAPMAALAPSTRAPSASGSDIS